MDNLLTEERLVIKKILLQPKAKFKYSFLKRFISDYEIREAPISFIFELVKYQLRIRDAEMSYQKFYFGFRKYRKSLRRKNVEVTYTQKPTTITERMQWNFNKEREEKDEDWWKKVPSSSENKKTSIEIREVKPGDYKDFNY